MSAATLPWVNTSQAVKTPRPVVFVDGRPEPTLSVSRLRYEGRLDVRSAELNLNRGEPADSFLGRDAAVALPRTLNDGETRWEVLAYGRLRSATKSTAAKNDSTRLRLEDAWTKSLEAEPANVWQVDNALDLRPALSGVIRSGGRATRSAQTYAIGGAEVYVLQTDGAAWTVGQALDSFSVFYNLELSARSVPTPLRDATLRVDVDLDRPLKPQLEQLLDVHGLTIRREIRLIDSAPVERRYVRPDEHGRIIHPPQSNSLTTKIAALKTKKLASSLPARPWIARGERPVVESTFALIPGWDADLEGQPDADYDRAASSDFSRFGNVYRRWVLNEDAHLPGEPFDLATLFEQPNLRPVATALRDCLTQDDAGRPLPPVVETSTDDGVTWTRYTDAWRRLDDRAGVVLDPTALDGPTLTAAKNQTLRVRVTASLRSPQPRETLRWRGNPFAETAPPVRLDVADQFRFRRVAPGSIHHGSIQAGTLRADEHDDGNALEAWLIEHLDREPAADPGSASLTLPHTRPELRVGDRLNLDPSNPAESADVSDVTCTFVDSPSTTLDLRF